MKKRTCNGEMPSGIVVLRGFLVLCVLFTMGCKKTPIDETSPSKLSHNVTFDKHTVPIGDSITVGWTSNSDSRYVLINNQKTTLTTPNGIKRFAITQNSFFVFYFTLANITETEEDTVALLTSNEPEMKISFVPNRAAFGSIASITVTTKHVKSVVSDLQGFSGIGGTFQTPPLFSTTVYHFTATGENGKIITQNITIPVDPQIILTPVLDRVSANPWMRKSANWKCSGGDSWQDLTLFPSDTTIKYVFYKNGDFKMFQYGSQIGVPCTYTINELDSSMILGDLHYKIHLYDTGMSLERQNDVPNSSCDDGLAYQLDNYIATTLFKKK